MSPAACVTRTGDMHDRIPVVVVVVVVVVVAY